MADEKESRGEAHLIEHLVGSVLGSVVKAQGLAATQLIDMVQAKAKGAKVRLEVLRDKKPMTFDVEVAEEESGGVLGSQELRDFLESWQGYTDAFQNELRSWNPDRSSALRQVMTLKGNLRRI